MIDDDVFELRLYDLQKLHEDIEKQLLQFDEIIPYEQQTTADIFSPRLLNMMLFCCPQIEAVTKLISEKCDFPLNENDDKFEGNKKSMCSKIN